VRPAALPGLLLALALGCLVPAAQADDQALLEQALATARAQAERALPALDGSAFGVDLAAYGAALHGEAFASAVWGGPTRLDLQIRREATGSCSRYAAFVRLPPENGVVLLVLCPQFFTPGADDLRVLTILHEMVHVVAGRDECQAMALAAQIEQLATGVVTPVDAYWAASQCAQSPYSLP
tara:strand:- start:63 stop:605 length:543 start_codon:yes stop_codon:yes gene_type:complete